jgi:NADH-quinone oxidoreductase subunit B
MLMDAILKLHYKIMNEPLGPRRARQLERAREDGTAKDLLVEMPSTVRVDKEQRRAYEEAAAEGRTGQFTIQQRGGAAVLLDPPRGKKHGR